MNSYITQLEPGIFAITKAMKGDWYRPIPDDVFEAHNPIVILYKEGLKEKADKYEGAEGYALL